MEDEYDEQSMTIEEFITAYPLPQRAKVTAGYLPSADEDVPDFSADDIIDIKRVLCPFVSLSFTNPHTRQVVCISASANYQDKFSIVQQSVLKKLPGLYMFDSIQELMQVWPSVFTAMPEPSEVTTAFTRSDKLRLIRLMPKITGSSTDRECEFRNLNTLQLFRLPLSFKCRFFEEKDCRSYTLRELIDIAPIARTLKLIDVKNISIPGIPINYDGFLKLGKPRLLLKVKRIYDNPIYAEPDYLDMPQETLLPVDTDLELSRREDDYTSNYGVTCRLCDIMKYTWTKGAFVVQIESWDEETTILQNQVTKPGSFMLIYGQVAHKKILAHCGRRFFLIPLKHNGMYQCVESNEVIAKHKLSISVLAEMQFPCRVKYSQSPDYINLGDDVLPSGETVTLDGVFTEETVLVSNLTGDVIQWPYHLPLRTGLRVRFIRRWKVYEERQMSHRDEFVEEVSVDVYNSLMPCVYGDYEYPDLVTKSASQSVDRHQTVLVTSSSGKSTQFLVTKEDAPPVAPPRRARSSREYTGNKPPAADPIFCGTRPPAPDPKPSTISSAPPVIPKSSSEVFSSSKSIHNAVTVYPKLSPYPQSQAVGPSLPLRNVCTVNPTLQALEVQSRRDLEMLKIESSNNISSDEDEEFNYSYIDMTFMNMNPDSSKRSEATVIIPSDGNISAFTVEQMSLFLRESCAPAKTIQMWKEKKINGELFSHMENSELKHYGIANPVFLFFRDKSNNCMRL